MHERGSFARTIGGAAAPAVEASDTRRDGGGTLGWVGPTDRPECVEAFRFCAERALQIAPRRTLQELIARPAERVGRVVVVRLDRSAAPETMLARIDALYPSAEKTLLLGSECEGESRSGQPWPQFQRVYWHRWNQVAPAWFAPTHAAARDTTLAGDRLHRFDKPERPLYRSLRQSVAVIAATRDQADGLLDWVAALGHWVVWLPTPIPASVRNVDVCLWDDSVAPPMSTAEWRNRLAMAASGNVRQRPRHGWVVGFPRVEDWATARRAGVQALISKPLTSRVLRDFIDHRLDVRRYA